MQHRPSMPEGDDGIINVGVEGPEQSRGGDYS